MANVTFDRAELEALKAQNIKSVTEWPQAMVPQDVIDKTTMEGRASICSQILMDFAGDSITLTDAQQTTCKADCDIPQSNDDLTTAFQAGQQAVLDEA